MTDLRRSNKKKKKKKIRWLRVLLTVFVLSFLIVGGYAAYLAYTAYDAANQSFEELNRGEKSKLREEAVELAKDPVSILIMGVEDYSTGGADGRSDTLILMTLNPKEKTMKMLSIPRDTRVSVPGRERKTKINHTFAYGGKDLTIETVEDLLEIPIDYYATVGFDGFKEIVDELNGVEVDVPFDFWEKSDETGKRIYFSEGPKTMNGEEALAYARMRKRDPRGDFGRNERQKQIISAAIDKAISPSNLLKIDDIAYHVGQNVNSNLRISEALSFQRSYSGFSGSSIDKLTLEGEDIYIGGVYYFEPDDESLLTIQEELQVHLEHARPAYSRKNTE
ncbi:LytR family transcriptional regulator [Bacillus lacus]|uniref:LytR family transcriptional regulator n=1 Tax=Metabacillus lacus TaxID=1983721 RepID=A0A7X2IYV9_9BACI|nr:LCP family protein [Metabacillus lacus]MRX72174.1 LytR family transcriptional regulator [Metabacillus lacus]